MWSKGLVKLKDTADELALSVAFTWHLPAARGLALANSHRRVRIGGPAADLMPEYLADTAAEVGGHWPWAVLSHNPDATRTTYGCRRSCPWCGVRRIEGPFEECRSWPDKRILIDNNLLMASQAHFKRVCGLLANHRKVDLQVLDARLLRRWHVDLLRDLDLGYIRFAWDTPEEEAPALTAARTMFAAGLPRRRVTICSLINAGETEEEALYRHETTRAEGFRCFPMRFQPLDTLRKNSYVDPAWDEARLRRFVRYWSRQAFLSGVPYAEYVHCARSMRGNRQLPF